MKELLRALRSNARASINEVAKQNNVAPTTLYDRFNKIEKELITKHTSLLDFESQNYGRHIFYILEEKNVKEIIAFLSEIKNVNNMYRMDSGIIIEVLFQSEDELEDFKKLLLKKEIIYSHHPILEVLKQEELIIE
jgi:DNA-binding Lrp family transcriptional regulator